MIEKLQKLVNSKRTEIVRWLDLKKSSGVPIYSSYDIRDNGTKAVIVDSNLFPGGFNNLTKDSLGWASCMFEMHISKHTKSKEILIIPEAHTRNKYYLSNLCYIKMALERAGYTVTIGSVREDIVDTIEVDSSCGSTLTLERMKNENGKLETKSFKDGIILLNNDFSVSAPPLLYNVKNPIMPHLDLGWFQRQKSNHFKHMNAIVKEFSDFIDIDPWLLSPATEHVNKVDFGERKNIDKIAQKVDEVILKTKKKYDEYGITEEPFAFVKDNSGTYGMGTLSLHSGRELLDANGKRRRRMKKGKQGSTISSVIVQEGISTKHKVNGSTAEPVLYSVGGKVVGGFMRIHDTKDAKGSLNAPGQKFDILLKDNITRPIVDFVHTDVELSIYEILADLATIAAGREMQEL